MMCSHRSLCETVHCLPFGQPWKDVEEPLCAELGGVVLVWEELPGLMELLAPELGGWTELLTCVEEGCVPEEGG